MTPVDFTSEEKRSGYSIKSIKFNHLTPFLQKFPESRPTLDDISFAKLSRVLQLLSLSFGEPTTNARKGKRALWMASKNASVSYTREISEEELRLVLRNAECPAGLRSNICSFLDETPLELVIMAVEEAGEDPIARSHIWQNVARLSTTIGSDRNSLWSGHGPSTGIE